MADRRRNRRRKEEGPEKPTKEEYAVAKFLRFNVPSREGKLVGMTVQYFVASKAVDALLDSKWGNKTNPDPLFTSRAGCVEYCDRLLQKAMFHRAGRVEKKKEKTKKKKPKEVEGEETSKDEKVKKEKKSKKSKEPEKEKEDEKEKETAVEATKEKEAKEEKKDEEKKKKKKVKLEMHDQQIFKDGEEYYVWIYDPVPLKTFLIGLLLVLGAIAVCLFPLWPPEVRLGVYYLSLAAAGFVGFILSLCVIRMILFCIVWGITFGKHHFWFLPNLTEDVGFFDSFRPLYKHDIMGEDAKDDDSKNKENKNTEKLDKTENESGTKEKNSDKDNDKSEADGEDKEQESGTGSEVDNDNGYEMVDPEEVPEKGDDQEVDGETKKTK